MKLKSKIIVTLAIGAGLGTCVNSVLAGQQGKMQMNSYSHHMMGSDANLGLKILKPTKVIKVQPNVDWKQAVGFGTYAGMVAMMNQMMVSGSGMESMKMEPMVMKFDSSTFAKEGAVVSEGSASTGMGSGSMTSGTGTSGSMGSASGSGADQSQQKSSSSGDSESPTKTTLKVMMTTGKFRVGKNTCRFKVTDANGKPVSDAHIESTVEMQSMDMGTAHPAVKSLGNGQYSVDVDLAMAGKWVISLKIPVGNAIATVKMLVTTS